MTRSEHPADGSARDRLHRLVTSTRRDLTSGGPAPGGAEGAREATRWVPGSPLPAEPEPDLEPEPEPEPEPDLEPEPDRDRERGSAGGTAADTLAVVTRMRAGALTSAATAYSAAYGHPLEHSRRGGGARRRWHLSVRLAVVAGTAIAVLGAGVAARATLATAPVVAPAEARTAAATIPGGTSVDDLAAAAGTGAAAPGSAGSAQPDPAAPDPAGLDPAGAAGGGGAGVVIVHVVGQVVAPGLVQLPVGARVSDAVAAAGGASPGADLSALNLARIVGDGEQIVVPAPGEVVAGAAPGAGAAGAAGAGSGGAAATGGVVDLNSADLAALDGLPGIGPVLAQRVLDWRREHGRFTAVDELGEVSGIGDALLGRLRALVRV